MPKMKTNRAAAKRFKKTGTGKFLYRHEGRRHNLGHKSQRRFRKLEKPGVVAAGHAKHLRKMLPYE